jgi:hypothetical protein
MDGLKKLWLRARLQLKCLSLRGSSLRGSQLRILNWDTRRQHAPQRPNRVQTGGFAHSQGFYVAAMTVSCVFLVPVRLLP